MISEKDYNLAYSRNREKLSKYIKTYRVLSVEDTYQEVFLRVWKDRALYEPRDGGSLDTWIFVVCRNVCLNLLDRHRLERKIAAETFNEPPEGEETSETGAHSAVLEKAVESLPSPLREVLIKHSIEGKTHREIAEELDISVENSKKRLQRAKVAVRLSLLN